MKTHAHTKFDLGWCQLGGMTWNLLHGPRREDHGALYVDMTSCMYNPVLAGRIYILRIQSED